MPEHFKELYFSALPPLTNPCQVRTTLPKEEAGLSTSKLLEKKEEIIKARNPISSRKNAGFYFKPLVMHSLFIAWEICPEATAIQELGVFGELISTYHHCTFLEM